jgi:adenine-specific DNA-methyltransferase
VAVTSSGTPLDWETPYLLWDGDVQRFLEEMPQREMFDLVVTSPPYNIGKAYEKRAAFDDYLKWQERVIVAILPKLKATGSICWQVGNYVERNEIRPLDYDFVPIFRKYGLKLRNRIVWHFGHGLHNKRRFSGRYEVVLWFTKTDNYVFNLDEVRVPAKYPGKRHFKGPKQGEYSSNPLGKNPEDVWSIPNVKSNHVEKTLHPCQFPVGLIERLVLALTPEGGSVFDPFCGVASAGVAAALHGRRFWGAEIVKDYIEVGATRLREALAGRVRYRPHDKAIYDHTRSPLSRREHEQDSNGSQDIRA